MKILIVDDNEEARLCLRLQLQSLGHAVTAEAETLAAAVKHYQTDKPELVILDLTLEREDGLTILAALRRVDPAAKVIILSANEMERIKKQALEAGAYGYLVKPLDEKELTELLRRA
jgi:two-component system, chemotaxis family, chemotaxis protein CheY